MSIDTLPEQLATHFNDHHLLQQALTHRSYINEQTEVELLDNERLEFLGDAILNFVAGELLYMRFPDMREGEMTRLRAALVRTEALAEFAAAIQLGDALLMGKGEEANGGRERPSNLCASLEALVGAIYLDRGMDAVRDFALPRFETLLERVLAEESDKDARSRLQEWCQAEYGVTPHYETVGESGPDHEKEFTVEVSLGERIIARGGGRSKQAAAQAAAQAALELVGSDEFTV